MKGMLSQKKLDTNHDAYCIKIGAQLWWTLTDSNRRPLACEASALTS